MLTLNDGRNELWQWDTKRKLTVDADCSQVHFSNKVFGRSLDVDVIDGVAAIPDILLQTDKELAAWAFVGTAENGYTKISNVFKVNRRNKPADYVFTPPEQTTLGEILERLDDIESAQDPDAIKNAVEDYIDNNPIRIEETDPTVPTWAKQPTKPQYTAAEVGALPDSYTPPAAPVQSVNGKTGAVNLTAEDVGALPANTEIPLPGITEESDPTVQGWAKTSIHAAVGQYFKVSAVDENGNVTAVEAVDAPSGGGAAASRIIEIADGVDVSTVSSFEYSQDADGNPLTGNKFRFFLFAPSAPAAKWLDVVVNRVNVLHIYYYQNTRFTIDIVIHPAYVETTFYLSHINGSGAYVGNNAADFGVQRFLAKMNADITGAEKTIKATYNYGINDPTWGEGATLYAYGEV